MKRVRTAVVGCGFWGRNQIRVLSELPNVELVGICDVDRGTVKELTKRYKVKGFIELHRLLLEDVDAITICTPTTTHYKVASEALKAGIHTLIEKPMTATVREAETLIELAENANTSISVGFIERFNPAVRYVKGLIDDGKAGKVILIMARRVSRWPNRIGDVGVLKDSAIHDVDVMRYILDSDVTSVYAKAGSLQHKYEDYSEIMVHFNNGAVGFIDANWLTPRKTRNLVVTGSDATIHLNYLTQEVVVEDSNKSVRPNLRWEEPLKTELRNFIDSILEGRRPSPDGIDGLKALKICEAALESSKTGDVIELTDN